MSKARFYAELLGDLFGPFFLPALLVATVVLAIKCTEPIGPLRKPPTVVRLELRPDTTIRGHPGDSVQLCAWVTYSDSSRAAYPPSCR
jgi:hypothetical protein